MEALDLAEGEKTPTQATYSGEYRRYHSYSSMASSCFALGAKYKHTNKLQQDLGSQKGLLSEPESLAHCFETATSTHAHYALLLPH